MCSGLNHRRIESIREQEQLKLLQQRLDEAFANDHSHTKELSEN